jgi:hypothetical protein
MADEETVVWGTKVSKEFKARVILMAKNLGTKADYLMAIMAFETGATFDPAQKNLANPTNGPVGLIQFTAVAAKEVGKTKAELSAMTAIEQLDYVEVLLMKKKSKGLGRLEDLYAAVHWPKAVGKKDDYVFYQKQEGAAGRNYRANSGLDTDKDDMVTLKEAAAMVRAKMGEGEAYRG